MVGYSHHAVDELVDEFFAVAPDTSVGEGVALLLETAEGGGELEGPEEVVGLLEVGADGPDLVDKVLNAGDTILAENLIDASVVVEGNAGAVDLTVTTGVDKLAGGGAGGETVGDEGLDVADHVHGSLVHAHENTVVELAETEELHDLLLLGGKLVDTTGTDNEGDLGLGLNEEVTFLLGLALIVDKLLVSGGVLKSVLLGVVVSDLALLGTLLLGSGAGGLEGGEHLGVTGDLLSDVFGNDSCPTTHQKMS
jgi:hypothetical protein